MGVDELINNQIKQNQEISCDFKESLEHTSILTSFTSFMWKKNNNILVKTFFTFRPEVLVLFST